MLLIRQRDATRLYDLASIDRSQIRVGFETGTTGDTFTEENISRAERRGFSNLELTLEALRKEDRSLKAQLDAALVVMHRDGRLQKIRTRWIPVRIETR